MDFEFRATEEHTEGHVRFHFEGSFTSSELKRLDLNPLYSAMVNMLKFDDLPHDVLLALEAIYRRHHEQLTTTRNVVES